MINFFQNICPMVRDATLSKIGVVGIMYLGMGSNGLDTMDLPQQMVLDQTLITPSEIIQEFMHT